MPRSRKIIIAGLLSSVLIGNFCISDRSFAAIDHEQKLALARAFVAKMKQGNNSADRFMDATGFGDVNQYNDGETFLLQPLLNQKYRLDSYILTLIKSNKPLISMRDFVQAMEMAITIDVAGKKASGWYIKEDLKFSFDAADNKVISHDGEFELSDQVLYEDDDIWVPAPELMQWFGLEQRIDLSTLELRVSSKIPFPIEARLSRRNNNFVNKGFEEPSLPYYKNEYKQSDIPVVDVSTNSSFRRENRDGLTSRNHTANIDTVGDFARGTLKTQTQMNNRDGIASITANYKQESIDASLLGPLHARRLEVGDVITTDVPLASNVQRELGFRVTNTDSRLNFSRATTVISGSAIPGWDVELYRDTQKLGFTEVDETGFYKFEDVNLYQDDNNFRVVFYGPQGEVREENVYVPFDRNLLARKGGVYDVSVSFDGKNTYNKNLDRIDNPDEGTLRLSALYEKPIVAGLSGSVGLSTFETDENRDAIVNAGLYSTLGQTLLNLDVSTDDEGEMASDLVLRRNLAEHEFRNTLKWRGAGFDGVRQSDNPLDLKTTYQNEFNVSGPFPIIEDINPHYSLGSTYGWDNNGEDFLTSSVGLNAGWRNISFNGDVLHQTASTMDQDRIDSRMDILTAIGNNRFRFGMNYNIKPNAEFQSLIADYHRRVTEKVDAGFSVEKKPLQELTEYQASLDWQAGFIRISPRIVYDTNQSFFAGLNTRFGLVRDPHTKKYKMYDTSLSSYGMMSAFVYLDKNGDGKFSEGDEPIRDAVVMAPQSGRRVKTDENGIALFNNMTSLRLTDVFIDSESFADPLWVVGYRGASVLPREGYVAELDFPVHMAGELDGNIYAAGEGGLQLPLRNMMINLYNDKGEIEQSAFSESDGFYYFGRIPPGRYLLMVDEQSAKNSNIIRPEPQRIEIGYDGTVIYSNDILVEKGDKDIPVSIIANMQNYKDEYKDIDFDNGAYQTVLNLGEYNSQVMMSLTWFKLQSRYGSIIRGAKIFELPSNTSLDQKSGKYILRVGIPGEGIDKSYKRCRALIARGLACRVEILPDDMKQAKL